VRERLEGKAKAMATQPTPQKYGETVIKNINEVLNSHNAYFGSKIIIISVHLKDHVRGSSKRSSVIVAL